MAMPRGAIPSSQWILGAWLSRMRLDHRRSRMWPTWERSPDTGRRGTDLEEAGKPGEEDGEGSWRAEMLQPREEENLPSEMEQRQLERWEKNQDPRCSGS